MPGGERLDVLETMREVRDRGMDAWAKTTLSVTSSSTYNRLAFLISQPGLILAGIVRKGREKAMARLLGDLNMPSREDVLALSQRLTHIQTAIDDLGAALEAARGVTAASPPRAARQNHTNGDRPRWRAGDR
jgi:hypothetical protein